MSSQDWDTPPNLNKRSARLEATSAQLIAEDEPRHALESAPIFTPSTPKGDS